MSTKEPLTLATIFNAPSGVGEKMIVHATGEIQNYFSNAELSTVVKNDLLQLFNTKKSEAKSLATTDGEAEVFMELIQPTVSIIIFGGGFDARPVSQLAKTLGWDVR